MNRFRSLILLATIFGLLAGEASAEPASDAADRLRLQEALISKFFLEYGHWQADRWPGDMEETVRQVITSLEVQPALLSDAERQALVERAARSVGASSKQPLVQAAIVISADLEVAEAARSSALMREVQRLRSGGSPSVESVATVPIQRRVLADLERALLLGLGREQTLAALERAYVDAQGIRRMTVEALFSRLVKAELRRVDPPAEYYAASGERIASPAASRFGLTLETHPDDWPRVVAVDARRHTIESGEIKPGDILLAVEDGTARRLAVGVEPQTLLASDGQVTLHVQRGSETRSLSLTLRPAPVVQLGTVDLLRIEPIVQGVAKSIGYVRLDRFEMDLAAKAAGREDYASTTLGITEVLRPGELDGLVLDLRGNTGGALSEVGELLDALGGDSRTLRVVGARGRQDNPFPSSDGRFHGVYDGPLVVLIDGTTVTGGEMLAAAIKASDRGLVLGGRTRGIGTVQNLVNLDRVVRGGSMGVLKLSIGEVCVLGMAIEDVGVEPHADWGFSPERADGVRRSRCQPRSSYQTSGSGRWHPAIRDAAQAPPPRAVRAQATLERTLQSGDQSAGDSAGALDAFEIAYAESQDEVSRAVQRSQVGRDALVDEAVRRLVRMAQEPHH